MEVGKRMRRESGERLHGLKEEEKRQRNRWESEEVKEVRVRGRGRGKVGGDRGGWVGGGVKRKRRGRRMDR